MAISPILAGRRRAVHAVCRELGLDEDARRDMLQGIAGVRSTTQLTIEACNQVLDHLKRSGSTLGKKVGRHPGAPTTLDRVPQLQKIEALLADMRLPWSYADTIARNVTGGGSNAKAIPRLGWVKESKHLQAVIVALIKRQKKLVLAQHAASPAAE